MKINVEHASIRLEEDKIIYFDPFDIKDETHDADYIFITHDHYDHYSREDIEKVKKPSTKIIVPVCLEEEEHTLVVEPGRLYQIDDIEFSTISSYNINKPYHKKEKGYVGYNILLGNKYYYIMGDTDVTTEAKEVKTNVCFIPIGGVYTMNKEEAVEYINNQNIEEVIPIHYGKIVGDITLGEEFKKEIKKECEVILKIKEEN